MGMDGSSSKFSLEFDSCFEAAMRCVRFLGNLAVVGKDGRLEWKLDCGVGGYRIWDGMWGTLCRG